MSSIEVPDVQEMKNIYYARLRQITAELDTVCGAERDLSEIDLQTAFPHTYSGEEDGVAHTEMGTNGDRAEDELIAGAHAWP